MQAGQVFTIEPIITLFPSPSLQVWKDNFTAISTNNPNAQFEHTLLLLEDGVEVLTRRPSEEIPNPHGLIRGL
jgi:methionyl aminopeptidase